MIKIDYPAPQFKLKDEAGKQQIFDAIRKRWVILTPEEWVRQNFIRYLNEVMKYPSSLMAIEKEIQLGELKKRCDIVIYKEDKPWMIIECKEMNVGLSMSTIEQVLQYNIPLNASYLGITNGTDNYLWELTNNKAVEIFSFPSYQ